MSLSLDGRLPSGRRAALLQHVARCESCSAGWESMQRAQDLALALPSYRVSSGFRQGLEQRIEAGEGSPEAIFHEPVPVMTKVRYVLTGAVAAALFLVGINLMREQPAAEPTKDVAIVTPENPSTGLVPRHSPPIRGEWSRVTENALTQTTATQVVHSANELRERIGALPQDSRLLQDSWRDVEGKVHDLRSAIEIMRWLEHRQIVTLPQTIEIELRQADGFVDLALNARSWDDRRSALGKLREVRFDKLQSSRPSELLSAWCCREPEDLEGELKDLVERIPDAKRVFNITPMDGATLHFGSPIGRGPQFMIRVIRQR